MEVRKRGSWRRRKAWSRGVDCLVPAVVFGWGAAQAQPILVPPTGQAERVPTVEQAAAAPVGTYAPPIIKRPDAPQKYPLELGPLQFHPHLGYQVSYGDGVFTEKTYFESDKQTWMIPLLKLFSMTVLLLESWRGSGKHQLQRAQLFRTIEIIGRWSMLDVYVVTVLVALVQ